MNLVIGLILLFLLVQAIKQFGRMDAATAARLIRHGGGVVGMIGALLLVLRGRIGLAAAVASMVANFAGWKTPGGASPGGFSNVGGGAGARQGRSSIARSAMVEMRLDHSSGAMTGTILSGAYGGRAVETLSRPELIALRQELARDDPDGVSLLEAYLDRRFAGWREADQGQRQRRGGDGAMTRREAFEVLGLAEGAGAADIIRAHRTLMKKFHPDHGGSTTLAARVNQAKDVLMQRQG
jgi:hypothetical protein